VKPVLLIDFGSTYTKLTAVDVESETLLGTAAAYTTIQTDINDGLTEGLKKLEAKIGKVEFAETYACSSAAGACGWSPAALCRSLPARRQDWQAWVQAPR